MNDESILARPECMRCHRPHAGFVFYYDLLVCGECALEMQKKESAQRRKWLEESNE